MVGEASAQAPRGHLIQPQHRLVWVGNPAKQSCVKVGALAGRAESWTRDTRSACGHGARAAAAAGDVAATRPS